MSKIQVTIEVADLLAVDEALRNALAEVRGPDADALAEVRREVHRVMVEREEASKQVPPGA